jgi:hemolysin III
MGYLSLGISLSMEQNSKYTRNEELANAISHFSGVPFAVAGLVLMVHHSMLRGDVLYVVSTSVFGATMILLYLASAITHILPAGRTKDLFFTLDRIAIYMLIAGTYTPITLIALSGPLGWTMFGVQWGLAAAGTWMILRHPGNYNRGVSIFYIVSYMVMGWMILIAVVPLMKSLPPMGTLWIFIGGGCYTLGIPFYKLFRFPYHHLVWHLLVLAGTAAHFFAVFYFLIPDRF